MFDALYFYYLLLLVGLVVLFIILNPFKKTENKNLTSEKILQNTQNHDKMKAQEIIQEDLPIGKISGERYKNLFIKADHTQKMNEKGWIEESRFEDDCLSEHSESIETFFENFVSGSSSKNVEITIISNNSDDYKDSSEEEIESLSLQKKAMDIINEKNEIEDFFKQAEKNVKQNKEIFEQFDKIIKEESDSE